MSYCDDCLHRVVCGNEGVGDEAMTYCCEKMGWIPVSERLPDDETDVLVCNKDGKIELTSGSRSTEVDDFIWYTSGWRFGDVVAWMPLPSPFEPQESEK